MLQQDLEQPAFGANRETWVGNSLKISIEAGFGQQ